MRQKIVFIADDGKQFDDEDACRIHEVTNVMVNEIKPEIDRFEAAVKALTTSAYDNETSKNRAKIVEEYRQSKNSLLHVIYIHGYDAIKNGEFNHKMSGQ